MSSCISNGGKPATVCIVEDAQAGGRRFAELIIGSGEFRCLATYRRAQQALAKIPSQKPKLIVVELALPRMSGSECIWRLKQKLPDLRALAVTSQPSERILIEALAAGADGYLEWPCAAVTFLQELRELAAGRTPLAEKARRLVLRYFRGHGPKAFLTSPLTAREREVLAWAGEGLKDAVIAKRLGIALCTVHSHLHNLYAKLGVHSRTAALRLIRARPGSADQG